MSKIDEAIAIADAALCKRRIRGCPSELSPRNLWGAEPIGPQRAIDSLDFAASCIERMAGDMRDLSALMNEPREDLQAGQLCRTARQMQELAAKIRREAGVAAWPNWWAPTVDLSTARPVVAQ